MGILSQEIVANENLITIAKNRILPGSLTCRKMLNPCQSLEETTH